MKVALGTVELTDFQARAVRLALEGVDKPLSADSRLPRAATREQCREYLILFGRNGVGKAEADLRYREARIKAARMVREDWRRGQPRLSDPGTSSMQELLP